MSGRRGSNPRPPAWEASALPTELLPHFSCILTSQIYKEKLTRTNKLKIGCLSIGYLIKK